MNVIENLLELAKSDLGYRESPPNSNKTKYGEWYGLNGQPWCMMAVQYWLNQAGIKPPVKTASCGAFLNAARDAGEAVYSDYQPGDVVIYDFDRDGTTDHCGIVEKASGATITAIEGNTSVGNDSDGGEVMRRTRNIYQIKGAWRPSVMSYEQFLEYMAQYVKELSEKDAANWGDEWDKAQKWAEDNGIIKGDQNGNKQYQAYTTRQALVLMIYRLVKDVL